MLFLLDNLSTYSFNSRVAIALIIPQIYKIKKWKTIKNKKRSNRYIDCKIIYILKTLFVKWKPYEDSTGKMISCLAKVINYINAL